MLPPAQDYAPIGTNHHRHLQEHDGDWHHQRSYQLKGKIFRHILKFSLEIIQNIYKRSKKSRHTWNEVKWNKQ